MNILISGGSRGLGFAMSKALVDRGHRVATFARTITPEAESFAAETNGRFRIDALDATDFEAVGGYVRELEREFGQIDGLVNNAAIGQDSLLVHTSEEKLQQLVNTNIAAPLWLTRHVVRSMMRKGNKGQVIMISSVGAHTGYAGLSIYSATKGALEAFVRSLAHEMKGRVLVNAIAPGFFASEMSSVLLPEQLETIARRTPSGELSTAQDVTNMLVALLENPSNINGAVISVDGGASI